VRFDYAARFIVNAKSQHRVSGCKTWRSRLRL
jgi:hypothetical protein